MSLAQTIADAAFEAFATHNRDVWQESADAPFGADAVYVERPGLAGEEGGAAPLPQSRPYPQIKRHLLRGRSAQRFVLHGQIGAGKSMELRRLSRDEAVKGKFLILPLSLSERLNLAAKVNIRFVLLTLAEAVAKELTDSWAKKKGLLGFTFGSDADRVLREWIRVLSPSTVLEGPDKIVGEPLILNLSAGLVSKTLQVRSDDDVRRHMVTEESYAPSRLFQLTAVLLQELERLSQRPVLLIIDDGDKIGDEESARDVFVQNLRLLIDLPASTVLTAPFWLHFDPDFLAASSGVQRIPLPNVKVIGRQDAEKLAAPGRAFFFALYEKLAQRSLIEDAALEEAARLSGGVPREFIRLLGRAFDLADEREMSQLDLATLRTAGALLRREMLSFTQQDEVRSSLIRVHHSQRLGATSDWKLLNALLIVEYTNDSPWYDVHPLLREEVERWGPPQG